MPVEQLSACELDAETRNDQRLRIGGFVPFSVTDYPGQLAAVAFLQGCPWQCVYCHNPHLIPAGVAGHHNWADIIHFLRKRQGLLDAVVFSGGEPTLQGGLVDAAYQVKSMGFRIGLHTGGMYPKRLSETLPLLDWIGLDIKAPQQAYGRVTGVIGSGHSVFESLERIVASGTDYELRCTWHPSLLSTTDLETMVDQLINAGADRLVIQIYRDTVTDNGLSHIDSTEINNTDFSSLANRLHRFALRE